MSYTCYIHAIGPKVGSHLTPFLYSLREPSELSQLLIIIIIIIIINIIIIIISC